jgi:hypothetical protein
MNEKMSIGYIETFPVPGLERWRKIPLSIEVTPDIDFLTATDEEIEAFMVKVRRIQYALKKQVNSFFFESLGHDQKTSSEIIQVKEPETPQSTEAKIIAQIYACSDLKVLESFKLLSGKYPAVKAAYEQQFEKLSKSS